MFSKFFKHDIKLETNSVRKKYNEKRFKNLVKLRKMNIGLSLSMQKYINNNNFLSENELDLSRSLVRSLNGCSSNTVMAFGLKDKIEYITSFTCNHKLCNICNWIRQKAIRRKYLNWFTENQYFIQLSKQTNNNLEYIYTTQYQLNKYEKKGFKIENSKIEYDLMTLTLTVPHTALEGWRGKKFYFRELKDAYALMRKSDEWNNLVYGGEYGIENTRNENGYHIHIHSLLFVKKMRKNRDILHRIILRLWNKYTIDIKANRTEFNENSIKRIKLGNKLIYDNWIENVLNPQGATLVSLETIFYIKAGKKRHVYNYNKDTMLRAVMETISYHFKPKMFIEKDGFYDIKSMAEILPQIENLPLYWKFGILHGEKKLNIKDNSLLDDYDETSVLVDEETGEVIQRKFFVADPVNMYVDKNDNLIKMNKLAKRKINLLNAQTGREAVQELINIVVKK